MTPTTRSACVRVCVCAPPACVGRPAITRARAREAASLNTLVRVRGARTRLVVASTRSKRTLCRCTKLPPNNSNARARTRLPLWSPAREAKLVARQTAAGSHLHNAQTNTHTHHSSLAQRRPYPARTHTTDSSVYFSIRQHTRRAPDACLGAGPMSPHSRAAASCARSQIKPLSLYNHSYSSGPQVQANTSPNGRIYVSLSPQQSWQTTQSGACAASLPRTQLAPAARTKQQVALLLCPPHCKSDSLAISQNLSKISSLASLPQTRARCSISLIACLLCAAAV